MRYVFSRTQIEANQRVVMDLPLPEPRGHGRPEDTWRRARETPTADIHLHTTKAYDAVTDLDSCGQKWIPFSSESVCPRVSE